MHTDIKLYGKSDALSVLAGKFAAQRFPHGVLFTGTAGVGKTVMSYYSAMTLLCENPARDFSPCRECRPCRKMLSGGHPDVIDALSLTDDGKYTADFVRGIVSDGAVRPNDNNGAGGLKIYIFRNLGGMSVICQNLLLKFIEEPPEYVRFFCTCDSDGIAALLPTVRSRLTAVSVSAVKLSETTTSADFYSAVCEISEARHSAELSEANEKVRRADEEKLIMSDKMPRAKPMAPVKSRKKSLKTIAKESKTQEQKSFNFNPTNIPAVDDTMTREQIGERLFTLSGGNIGTALSFAGGMFNAEFGIAAAAADALAVRNEYLLGAAVSKMSEQRELFRGTLVFIAEILKDAAGLRHLRDTGYRKGSDVDLTGVFSRCYDAGSKRIAGAYTRAAISNGAKAVTDFLSEIEFNTNFNIKLGSAVFAAKLFEAFESL